MSSLLRSATFITVLLISTSAANAQRCGATCANAESLLRFSEQALIASVPELERVPKPLRGPRNSYGKWMLPNLPFATQNFVATYYIRLGKVTRIELLNTAPKQQCVLRSAFNLALEELSKQYGESPAMGSFEDGGKSSQSVAFHSQSADIALYLLLSPEDCLTRIVYTIREVKDASEL